MSKHLSIFLVLVTTERKKKSNYTFATMAKLKQMLATTANALLIFVAMTNGKKIDLICELFLQVTERLSKQASSPNSSALKHNAVQEEEPRDRVRVI
jgi:hypothetical protein